MARHLHYYLEINLDLEINLEINLEIILRNDSPYGRCEVKGVKKPDGHHVYTVIKQKMESWAFPKYSLSRYARKNESANNEYLSYFYRRRIKGIKTYWPFPRC